MRVMAEHKIILISLDGIFWYIQWQIPYYFALKFIESFAEKSFGLQAYSDEWF